jgi:hypothetical protein
VGDNKKQVGAEEYYRAGCLLSQVAANYELAWLYPSLKTKPHEAFCDALGDVDPIFSPLAGDKETAAGLVEAARELSARWQNEVFRSPKHLGARAAVFACPKPCGEERECDTSPALDFVQFVSETVVEITQNSPECWPDVTDWGRLFSVLTGSLREKLQQELFMRLDDGDIPEVDVWPYLNAGIPLTKQRADSMEQRSGHGSLPAWQLWEETKDWYTEQIAMAGKEGNWNADQLRRIRDALGHSFGALWELVDFRACLESILDHPRPEQEPAIAYKIDCSRPAAMQKVLSSDAFDDGFYGDVCTLLENGVDAGRSGGDLQPVWFTLGIYLNWSQVRLPCFLPPPLRDRKKLMGGADEPKEVVRWALHRLNCPLLLKRLDKKNWVSKVKGGLERDFGLSLPDHRQSYQGPSVGDRQAVPEQKAERQLKDLMGCNQQMAGPLAPAPNGKGSDENEVTVEPTKDEEGAVEDLNLQKLRNRTQIVSKVTEVIRAGDPIKTDRLDEVRLLIVMVQQHLPDKVQLRPGPHQIQRAKWPHDLDCPTEVNLQLVTAQQTARDAVLALAKRYEGDSEQLFAEAADGNSWAWGDLFEAMRQDTNKDDRNPKCLVRGLPDSLIRIAWELQKHPDGLSPKDLKDAINSELDETEGEGILTPGARGRFWSEVSRLKSRHEKKWGWWWEKYIEHEPYKGYKLA